MNAFLILPSYCLILSAHVFGTFFREQNSGHVIDCTASHGITATPFHNAALYSQSGPRRRPQGRSVAGCRSHLLQRSSSARRGKKEFCRKFA